MSDETMLRIIGALLDSGADDITIRLGLCQAHVSVTSTDYDGGEHYLAEEEEYDWRKLPAVLSAALRQVRTPEPESTR